MKKKVAIVGVTGSVGQEFVQSLKDHPWFEVTQIAASERSAGKKYVDSIKDPSSGIVKWEVGGEIPEYIKEMTVKAIDDEVRQIIDCSYNDASEIIKTNIKRLHKMAEALIKYETLDENQINDVMNDKEPRPPEDWDQSDDSSDDEDKKDTKLSDHATQH